MSNAKEALRRELRTAIMFVVANHGAVTASDISAKLGRPIKYIAPRLTELVKSGHLVRSGAIPGRGRPAGLYTMR